MNMDNLLRTLGGVLGFQALLAMITWWPQGSADAELRDLVPPDAAELARITIHPPSGNADGEPMVLEKKSGTWRITSLYDYPAADQNLDTLFETIDKIKVRSPVSRRDYNQAEMGVADDTYYRKLDLVTEAGKEISLYFGSAQGKAAHVRVGGDNDVYRVRGISAAIPERPTRYFERDFQKIDVDSVRSLTIRRPGEPPIDFVYTDGTWALPGLTPEGKEVDQGQARAFVQSAVNLRMLTPLGTTATPDMGLTEGVSVQWTEEQSDGTSLAGEYRVGAEVPGETGQVYLQSSTAPYVFAGLTAQLQHAREKTVDSLFVDPAPELPDLP